MSYPHPIYQTISLKALALASAATAFRVIGPKGKTGVIADIGGVVSTDTDAAQAVNVGDSTTADKFGTLDFASGATAGTGVQGESKTVGEVELPADTPVEISTPGGGTAGAADVAVTIAWF